jgi:hypothetical protein
MNNPFEFDYIDLIHRKFKEFNSHDSSFKDQYGFRSFHLHRKLDRNLYLTWCPIKRQVVLERRKKKVEIVSSILVKDLIELDLLIEFFTDPKGEVKLLRDPNKPQNFNIPLMA